MKKYKCMEIEEYGCDTEEELNRLAKDGWKVICSYAKHGEWVILEKDFKPCSKCGS